jgi:hypothetical protein
MAQVTALIAKELMAKVSGPMKQCAATGKCTAGQESSEQGPGKLCGLLAC